MKLSFVYAPERDAENLVASFNSKNSSKRTKLQEQFILEYGLEQVHQQNALDFVRRHKPSDQEIQIKIESIRSDWGGIADQFVQKAETLFGVGLDAIITVYLSTNSRCTYNIPEGYFFLYIDSKSTNHIIMHELFHFYTWHAFGKELVGNGLSKTDYNDIKESLTELLNIEFANLMPNVVDSGYPQHATLRARVRSVWKETRDLRFVVNELINK